jgi:regulator of cell morphogenesis and NO signaling
MQTITEKTVREIAVETPSSVRVFESLGIDYCCGGKRSLGDACSSAKVDLSQLVDMLAKAELEAKPAAGDQWHAEQLAKLIAHVVEAHHGYVRRQTPFINSLLSKVTAKHGPAHPQVLEIEKLFTAIAQELSTHMLKEEQVLFPHIERLERAALNNEYPLPAAFFGTVRGPIANMMADHDDAGALLSAMRKLADDYNAPAGACPTFRALYSALEEFERDLHRHVHLENNILFPRAVELERAQPVQ